MQTGDVRIFIFDNRVEIINPGHFPKGTTPHNPKHNPINNILCQFFYDVGLIEKYGSGIQMMKKLSRKWGNKEPYYRLHPIETKIIFESPIAESSFIVQKGRLSKEDRQKILVEYLKKNEKIKIKEYLKLTNISIITAKRDLREFRDKNIIKFVGSKKTGFFALNDTLNGTINIVK